MSIPREFIELLLARIDIVDLINAQIPLRKKSGSNYFARCPFHNEKSASFSVSQTKQFYYCFGCGAHGNAIDFMMQHDRLSFPEAIESLARQIGMETPQTTTAPKKADSRENLYDFMHQVTTLYYEQMRHSERAVAYLKKRGISGQIAQQFNLGYAPPGWSHLLDKLGKTEVDKKKLVDTGLIIKKPEGGYYDRFRDRILFPIHDIRGRVIGFGGRIIDQGDPKYLNSPETALFQKGHELYGLYQAIKANRQLDRLLLVEGYMDVIALFQQGITYAVATLGTATTAPHLQRLMRYTTEIIFCFDGDTAGRTAAWRALQVMLPLMNDHIQVRILFLPEGEDPDSLVRKEGPMAFNERVAGACSLATFFFQSIAKQSDVSTMEGRAQFAALALKYLRQIPQTLFQSILLEELSKRARIDLKELKQQVHQPQKSQPIAPTQALTSTPSLTPPLRLAIALLLQYPSLGLLLTDPLPQTTQAGLVILNQLIEIIKKNNRVTTGALLEYWRGEAHEPLMTSLAHFEHLIPEAGLEKAFTGALQQLHTQDLESAINALLAKAAQEGLSADERQELTRLIAQKKNLVTA